jgi:sugar phosphate isomerase/epimerase
MTGPAHVPPLKGRFPFRLGATSYVIPDHILPNVRFLAPFIDDIELVLFESEPESNIPTPSQIAQLADIARDNALSYTVHLPFAPHLGSASESDRAASVAAVRRIADLTLPLDPFAWIVHLEGESRGPVPAADLPAWLDSASRSVSAILASGIPPDRLCVENLSYPFSILSPVISAFDLAVCADIGHLLLYNHELQAHLDAWTARIRVVHLHGLANGHDHRDLTALDPALLARLLAAFASFPVPPAVTVEVFGLDDWRRSMEVLNRYG